ncbi:MAG: glycosyltransferase [Chitinophagales bacterium]
MRIETCISTLDDGIHRIAADTFLQEGFSLLIVHQVTQAADHSALYKRFTDKGIRIITLQGKGLSISRNAALENAQGDWLWICDDDVLPEKGTYLAMVNSIQNHRSADILTFRMHTPEGNDYKKYPADGTAYTLRSATRISSVEILISSRFLQQHTLRFDTAFGLASTYPSGEEYIFITDALRKGAQVIHSARHIGVHSAESSGQQFHAEQIIGKGAMFARVFKGRSMLYNYVFSWKKYKSSAYSFWQFYRLMAEGRKKYLHNA